MQVPRFQPGLKERRALKRLAKRVFTALLGETDEFRDKINAWENTYVSFQLVGRVFKYVTGFAGITALVLVPLTMNGQIERESLPLLAAGGLVVSFVAGLILSLVHRTGHEASYQRAASLYIRTKKLENFRFFPFRYRQGKPKRDARKNLSGKMILAVERRIQLQPRLIHEKAEAFAPPDASNRAAELALTSTVQDAVAALSPETPAVRVDKFFERKLMFHYAMNFFRLPTDEQSLSNYFLLSRGARNAVKAGLALQALDSIMRDERRSNPLWRRTYRTNPAEQVTVLKENEDMRLRFRTASPHLNWPDEGDDQGDFETAQHLVLQCVQNPLNLPVYLISVQDVVSRIDDAIAENRKEQGADLLDLDREAVMSRLLTNAPVMFSRWNTAAMRHRDQTPNNQPILFDFSDDPENPDYGIRYDVNRIDWSSLDETDQELLFAFASLYNAVELAGEDAARCVLRRGDALLIDNHRCLTARREFGASEWSGRIKYGLGLNPVWDVKAYSGFRPTRVNMSIGGS